MTSVRNLKKQMAVSGRKTAGPESKAAAGAAMCFQKGR
ncbi:MAG: hypothetical protein ACI8W6_000958 [Porticoccaceae bacterium]|jgi:hypothetical protein